MRSCINFSDPVINSRFTAIEDKLGRAAAVREFLMASKQDREMRTPDEVEASIDEIFKPRSQEEMNRIDQERRDRLKAMSNDPSITDPDSLDGFNILYSPMNTKSTSIADNSRTRGLEIANKLSQQLGVEYQIVSAEEAAVITGQTKNPFDAAKNPAFFHEGVVYFISDRVNTEIALHEFSHPLVRTIQKTNPELFEKLVNDAITADPSLKDEALREYMHLSEEAMNELDPTTRAEMLLRYNNIVKEEILVKALTKAALNKDNQSKGLRKIVDNILYAIKQMLRKVFGSKVNVAKLEENTSLDQLAQMLTEGKNFEIDTQLVSQADIVAYYTSTTEYLNSLKEAVDKVGKKAATQMVMKMFEGSKMQVRKMVTNENYREMLELFADEFGRGALQEMRDNLSKYQDVLMQKSEDLSASIEANERMTRDLLNSMLQLEVVMNKMRDHLKELQKETQNQDSVHKAFYYGQVLDYWQKYVKEVLSTMNAEQIDSSNPVLQLMNSINNTMTQSSLIITNMNMTGIADVLWEKWEDMSNQAEETFKNKVDGMTKRGASKAAINDEFVKFYGMPQHEYEKYKRLEELASKDQITYQQQNELEQYRRATLNGIHMSKYKIEKALIGQHKDVNFANSYLEGYMYNTDPVIGGFAMYYKDNMAEAENRAQEKYNDFVNDYKTVAETAGINRLKIGELGQQIGFTDTIGQYDPATGTVIPYKVWSLLSAYKDYRFDIDQFNHKIREAEKQYNHTGSLQDKLALANLISEKAVHMKREMQQDYVDEYYEKDELFTKDDIGRLAALERGRILDQITSLTNDFVDDRSMEEKGVQIDNLWKDYRLLHSLYYANGTKKTNSFVDANGNTIVTNDLAIAERLQEYRAYTRKFYEFRPRSGAFQSAFKEQLERIKDNLNKQNLTKEEYNRAFQKEKEEWLAANTRTAIKKEYYDKRSEYMATIKRILAKLPSTQENSLNFDEYFKVILDSTSGYRDDDGQPVGGEVPEGRKALIKKAEESMEKAKAKWAGLSGLTTIEMNELLTLTEKREKNKGKLDKDDFERYTKLLSKKKSLGLDKFDTDELLSTFVKLSSLQEKVPTLYYIDAVNSMIGNLDLEWMEKRYNTTRVTAENVDIILNEGNLKKLFKQSPEFEKWYKENHYIKKVYDEELGTKVDKYQRIYVWNQIRPVDKDLYESTVVIDENGAEQIIPGLPSLKYYNRVVKDQYKTGYDPKTGKVNKVVGVHVDNRGEYLPKPTSTRYRNERYFELKNAKPGTKEAALFKVLEIITKHHIANQKGLPKSSKLYLDFPRFEKSNLELLQSGIVGKKAKETGNAIQLIFKRIRDFFKGAKADVGGDLNWKNELMLVRLDAFDNEVEQIPIQGLSKLTVDETSTDIVTSMLTYMFNAETQKQLIKMNPVARGIKNVLSDPNNLIKELDQVNQSNMLNTGDITYKNKKGKYVRLNTFNNFYDREFLGQSQTGWLSGSALAHNIQKQLFKRASFSFFAFNIPSALKNMIGAKLQSLFHAAAGKDIDFQSLARGEAFSTKYMTQLSSKDIYAKGNKSLLFQIGEIFDPAQGRFRSKMPEALSRSLLKDSVESGMFYNFRSWTELQATMQLFGGMMYKKKIMMGNKEIPYIEAFELGPDGKIKLKAGIDPKYGPVINYEIQEGDTLESIAQKNNTTVDELMKINKIKVNKVLRKGQNIKLSSGTEFLNFRRRIHSVVTKLNGAYAKLDQPEAQRYHMFRYLSFQRRFFVPMMMNRFGKKRWNPGYGSPDEGYYITAVTGLWKAIKNQNIHDLSPEDRQAWQKIVTEMGTMLALYLVISMLFGYDPDDEERFEKLRKKSGPLAIIGTGDSNDDFDLGGFLSLHALSLAMSVKAEQEQFIPLPGFGLDNAASLLDLKSIAFGPTTDKLFSITDDIMNIVKGDEAAYYKRKVGPYAWQDQGGLKLWNHLAKMFGITGTSIDPANAITNFQKNIQRRK